MPRTTSAAPKVVGHSMQGLVWMAQLVKGAS